MTNDSDEFDKVVGSDRLKLEDVEYLKTIKLREAIILASRLNLSKKDRDKFLTFFIKVVHADKTMDQLASFDEWTEVL